MKKLSFKHTFISCYIGYFVQATVCGFLPLLFVIFNREYNIPLPLITLLTTVSFLVQMTGDSVSILFVEKIGYRKAGILSYLLAAAGLFSLGVIAPLFSNIYIGILISTIITSMGGGVLEVVLSPVIESCPSKNKSAAMSMLHAMFGFGSAAMIFLTTILLKLLGWQSWQFISVLWAIVPLLNAVYFMFVPINDTTGSPERTPMKVLITDKRFWTFMLVMTCGGGAEIAMSQWASAFAEASLGVTKAVGDIMGPCAFALMMAFSRFLYSKIADKVSLSKYIIVCGFLTCLCYLTAAFTPISMIALIACGMCGFMVGIFWPGTLSLAAKAYPNGGSAMFALLALGGDIGCTLGPTLVGLVASLFGGELKTGLLMGMLFPVGLILSVSVLSKKKKQSIK